MKKIFILTIMMFLLSACSIPSTVKELKAGNKTYPFIANKDYATVYNDILVKSRLCWASAGSKSTIGGGLSMEVKGNINKQQKNANVTIQMRQLSEGRISIMLHIEITPIDEKKSQVMIYYYGINNRSQIIKKWFNEGYDGC